MLIGDILADAANQFPDKLAIICGKNRVTYSELDNSANRFANALVREGLTKDHNIAIYSPNQTEYPTIFFGAARSGVVLAHMSSRFTIDELESVINRTDIEALFVHISLSKMALNLRERVPHLKRIIIFENT